jgi:cytochrome c553
MPRSTATLLGVLLCGSAPFTLSAAEGFAFFESQVRPLLVKHCYECHSEESGKQKGGLWLDRKAGWETGGDGGPAIVPGSPDASLLIHSVRYADEALQMPPKSKMTAQEIGVLEQWVAMGALDPRDEALSGSVRKGEIDYESARREWAFRPVVKPSEPAVAAGAWPLDPVDRFVLAKLEEKQLRPAAAADPAALLRRLHFDLTGLPPTSEETLAFASDPSREAFVRIVDDLLSRPGFGEKWGRHWLDVARYADSNGGDRNYTFYQAWRYRNHVIDVFNRDQSYHEFVREQIAGDLMPSGDPATTRRRLIASTFLALGPKMLTERDKEKLWLDTVDEQVDTLGRAFLGLALGCARCHDHKFDPVSQADYFALAGIFRSTEIVTGTRNGCVNVASWVERPLPGPNGVDPELARKVERLELAMRLVVEKTYMKKAGGKMTDDHLPLAGVIYDESDAEVIGHWPSSDLSPNRFGARYLRDDREGKGEKRVIFRGSLPESGRYEVRIAYSAGENRSEKVPVVVGSRTGLQTVHLDQTRTPAVAGLFEPIGQFDFEKGAECSVTIETAGTEGRHVLVDAVQFIAVADLEREKSQLAAVTGESAVDPLFRMSEDEVRKTLDQLIADLKDADVVMAPRDADAPADIHLRIRGETGQLGPVVPRGFPKVLSRATSKIVPDTSGRRELADWLTGEAGGLLDRVYVNRVWGHLFGRGLVESVDNFGRLGSGPTHPELLDWLAATFRAEGGSTKQLVRRLVLSRTYGLSANPDQALADADPENELFGRHGRRRLTAEEIRDSILFFSGRLDRTPGGATATAVGIDLDAPLSYEKNPKRTVYLPVARNNPSGELALFDGANPDLVTGRRNDTTVPTQALYLLNSGFLLNEAGGVAKSVMKPGDLPGTEVDRLFLTLLGRGPHPLERDRAMRLIADLSGGGGPLNQAEQAVAHLAHLLMASTEFLYLE